MIVCPPKSGASRLRCLLATLYGLRAVDARDAPEGNEPANGSAWLETLPDDSVTHTDLPFDQALLTSAARLDVTLIAITRHPFDLFISNRDVRSHRNQRANRRSHAKEGADAGTPSRQAIDLEYSMDLFAVDLQTLLDWSSVAAVTVHYEDILEHPGVVLTILARVFGNLDEAKAARAIELCPAEQRIVSSGNRGVRMTELPPGSWQSRIDADTLEQLQRRFGQAVVRLGYEPSSIS